MTACTGIRGRGYSANEAIEDAIAGTDVAHFR
jgi:hypothetical protein